MKRARLLFLLAWLIIGGAQAQTNTDEDIDAKYASRMIQPGEAIPDLLVDSAKNLRLSDLKGCYVVLHFWASWCPDCRKDMPKMQELCDSVPASVIPVHISYDTDKARWQKYLVEHPLKGINTCELKKFKETESSKLFHIDWIPSMYLINPEGKVELATVDINKLEKALKHLDMSAVKPHNTKVLP